MANVIVIGNGNVNEIENVDESLYPFHVVCWNELCLSFSYHSYWRILLHGLIFSHALFPSILFLVLVLLILFLFLFPVLFLFLFFFLFFFFFFFFSFSFPFFFLFSLIFFLFLIILRFVGIICSRSRSRINIIQLGLINHFVFGRRRGRRMVTIRFAFGTRRGGSIFFGRVKDLVHVGHIFRGDGLDCGNVLG